MSLVDTFHRAHLERQLRIRSAALRHLESRVQTPQRAEIIEIKAAPAPAPEPADTWVERQIGRFKEPWFQIIEGPKAFDGERKPPEVREIIRVVGRHYLLSVADILSDRRMQDVVKPRQVGMYLCKQLTNRSLPEIGQRFGGRDHTTVLHAVRKIAIKIARDAAFAEEVEAIREKCERA